MIGYCLVGKSKKDLLSKEPIYSNFTCNYSTSRYFVLEDGRIAVEIFDGGLLQDIIKQVTKQLTSL